MASIGTQDIYPLIRIQTRRCTKISVIKLDGQAWAIYPIHHIRYRVLKAQMTNNCTLQGSQPVHSQENKTHFHPPTTPIVSTAYACRRRLLCLEYMRNENPSLPPMEIMLPMYPQQLPTSHSRHPFPKIQTRAPFLPPMSQRRPA